MIRTARDAARGAIGGLRDTILEVKDSVIKRQEAPDEFIEAPTPEDRWWTPREGWPKQPAAFPAEKTPEGYKVKPWKAPPALIPTAAEAPHLFEGECLKTTLRAPIGTLSVEVLQCEDLPKMMVGIADPYALLVFEGFAARTSTIRNDRTPVWGAEAPRAFRFPVTCPYSELNVAVNDEDEGLLPDDALGRVIIDLSQICARTVFDCWYDLEYSMIGRAKGRRGTIRLRYSVEWHDERLRLLEYPRPPPSYAVPFRSKKAMGDAKFAVQGRFANPARFDSNYFASLLRELKRFIEGVVDSLLKFLFWKWPILSASAFVMYQLVVSYPTESIAMLPVFALVALGRSYMSLPTPHPLEHTLTLTDLILIVVTGRGTTGQAYDPAHASASELVDEWLEEDADEHGGGGGDDDDDGQGSQKDGNRSDGSENGTPPASPGGSKSERRSASKKRAGGVMSKMGSAAGAINPLGSVTKALDVFKPAQLDEDLDQMRWEVEQEIYSHFPEDDVGFVINPIAKALGPVQKIVYNLVVGLRTAHRMATWDDKILSFQLGLALVVCVVVLFFFGELLMLVPWGLVWECLFRLLGAAAFGPHMYWFGKEFRAEQLKYEAQRAAYATGDRATRKAIMAEHKAAWTAEVRERFELEMGELPPSEEEELAALLATADSISSASAADNNNDSADGTAPAAAAGTGTGAPSSASAAAAVPGKRVVYYHMLVRPRPNAGALRFRILPHRSRSRCYPLRPAEDRPPLQEEEEEEEGLAVGRLAVSDEEAAHDVATSLPMLPSPKDLPAPNGGRSPPKSPPGVPVPNEDTTLPPKDHTALAA